MTTEIAANVRARVEISTTVECTSVWTHPLVPEKLFNTAIAAEPGGMSTRSATGCVMTTTIMK